MDTLASLIDRRAPVSADSSCVDVAARFLAEPDIAVLAVTVGDAPVGLITRDMILPLRDDARPVRQVMDPAPLLAPASMTPWGFRDRALTENPAALTRGFIAVEDGRYIGVGTAVTLLGARRIRARSGADTNAALIRRLTTEVLHHLEGAHEFTQRLLRQQLPPDAQACVRAIEETGGDLTSLMRRALDLHDAETGQLAIRPQPCLLRGVVDALDERWKARAAATGVSLLCAYDGDPECAANIDQDRLLQVFDALVQRALGETRRGAVEATLKVRPSPEGLLIEGRVRDAGPELSPERLARIFDPVSVAAEDHIEGLSVSLGMALANRLAIGAGGVIRAEPNAGAGVTVVFEFFAQEAAASSRTDQTGAVAAAQTAHVLIVDDNATNRMVAEALCEMFDCTSEQAEDGLEALEAVKARRFDLILMDIKMPRMDGVTATRAIRAMDGPRSRTPIIALTANADAEDVRGYLEAGMNDVVEKPIKAERMLEALDAALQASAAAAEAA